MISMPFRVFFVFPCLRALVVICALAGIFAGPSHAADRPNIVLVTLESVRADRVDVLGSKHLTPILDALAKQSIVFENAYSQAPTTLASHATILTGVYPQTHGASEPGGSLAASTPYVPDLLRAKGYRTAAIVGSILLDPRNGYAPGFDRGFGAYDTGFGRSQATRTNHVAFDRSASQVIARAEMWLARNGKEPFFLWVHLNDANSRSGPAYDRAVTADDAAIGKLVAVLRAKKLYENSVVVVASDHGESLGAHGEDTHGIFLYDETIHVPLLVKLAQKQLAGKRIKGRVRLVDIAPTLLEAAGLPVPSQMQGQSLIRVAKLTPDTDQAAYARNDFPKQAFGWSALESWRSGKYLYIRAPKPELYDLSADPKATRNLAQSSKAITETMASQLAAFETHFGGTKSSGNGLSSSEMEKLASLGYVGLQKTPAAQAAVSGIDPKDTIGTANEMLAAMSVLQQGLSQKAIPALRQVAAKDPDAYLPHYGLGVALAEQKSYKEAIEHLHKAIELRPDSGLAQYQMGICLLRTGDFKTSAVHLEIATGRLPSFAAVHAALAEAYEHLGRKEEASRERAKASQVGPS
jgi:choline-sulfatase